MRLQSKLQMSLSKRRGNVVLRSELAGLGSKSQLTEAINGLISEGRLVRLSTGIYAKSSPDPNGHPQLPAKREALLREADERRGSRGQVVPVGVPRATRAALPADVDELPTQAVAEFVETFARKSGIRYRRSGLDLWAEAVTRASGDDVRLDHTQELLVALRKKNLLNDRQFSRLLTNHMREIKRVRSVQGLRAGGLSPQR